MSAFRAVTQTINDRFENFCIVNIYTNETVFDYNLMQNCQGLKCGAKIPIIFQDKIVVENDCGDEYVTYDDLSISIIVQPKYLELKIEYAPEMFHYLFIPK